MCQFSFDYTIKNKGAEEPAESFYWAKKEYRKLDKSIVFIVGCLKIFRCLIYGLKFWRRLATLNGIEGQSIKKLINSENSTVYPRVKLTI